MATGDYKPVRIFQGEIQQHGQPFGKRMGDKMKNIRKQKELDKFRAEFDMFQEQTAPDEFHCTRKVSKRTTPYGRRSEPENADNVSSLWIVPVVDALLVCLGALLVILLLLIYGLHL